MFKVVRCSGPEAWAVVADVKGATPYLSKHRTRAEAVKAARKMSKEA